MGTDNSWEGYMQDFIDTAPIEDLLLLAEARERLQTKGDNTPNTEDDDG